MTSRIFRPLLTILGTLVLLSGCDSNRLVLCPAAAVLADAATRPVLKPGSAAADPSAVLYTVELTDIHTSCSVDTKNGVANSDVTISFRATRAHSGPAVHYTVPYFLAINQGARIINKRMFDAQIDFPAGAASVTFSTAINSTQLKLANGHVGTDYQFLAGFEISDAERAYLKTMGRFAP